MRLDLFCFVERRLKTEKVLPVTQVCLLIFPALPRVQSSHSKSFRVVSDSLTWSRMQLRVGMSGKAAAVGVLTMFESSLVGSRV